MSEPFRQENERILSIKSWQNKIPGLIAGFTTRTGGVSEVPFDSLNIGLHVNDDKQHVLANRKLLLDDVSFSINEWVSGEQVHKTKVKKVDKENKGSGAASLTTSIPDTDGLITDKKGIFCIAYFADCVPLFFFDPKTEYIGIAHAGWKGTVNGMASNMVSAFQEEGVLAEDLLVAIGPCISTKYYEVDEHVISHIPSELSDNAVIPQENARFLLDLKQLNVDILLQSGVLRNNIDVTSYCTYKDEQLFFSHRRDEGKTGRMAGFIGFSL
ncbi:peptidoglycan editing factor PgeF [Virgibacillus oceani]